MSEPAATETAALAARSQGHYTVAAVARRLGMASATLRTWDRRYGMGPSEHEVGHHRRYSEEDLARLKMMRQLIVAGSAPADAAAIALAGLGAPGGSGKILAAQQKPTNEIMVDTLYFAILALDTAFVRDTLQRLMDEQGTVAVWSQVIAPLLEQIGYEWATNGNGIDIEHSLSAILIDLFIHRARVLTPRNESPVVLACAPEEQHVLPLYALAASLAESGVASHLLGPRTPNEALAALVSRNGPAAIFIWAQSPQSAKLCDFAALPTMRPSPRVVTGGPGFAGLAHPKGIDHASSLTRACELILGSIGF